MPTNHHKRENYENLFHKLAKETGTATRADLSKISDYALLYEINIQLAKLNCVLFSREELEMELA